MGNIIEYKALDAIECLHNFTEGPAARMVAFRSAVRACLEILGVEYETFFMNEKKISIKKGAKVDAKK